MLEVFGRVKAKETNFLDLQYVTGQMKPPVEGLKLKGSSDQ